MAIYTRNTARVFTAHGLTTLFFLMYIAHPCNIDAHKQVVSRPVFDPNFVQTFHFRFGCPTDIPCSHVDSLGILHFANQQSSSLMSHATQLFALPIRTVPKTEYPPRVTLDFEALLRAASPKIINFNTTLRPLLGVERLYTMDSLDRRIYDRQVLLKQLAYFIKVDDFSTIKTLLRENQFLLYKEETSRLLRNVVALLFWRFYYNQTLPDFHFKQLLEAVNEAHGTNYRNHRRRNAACNTTVNFLVQEIGNEGYTRLSNATIQQICDKIKFGSLVNHTDETMRIANTNIQKRYLLFCKGLRYHGCLGLQRKRNKWKYRRKTDWSQISPYLTPPAVFDEDYKRWVNKQFREAVAAENLTAACLYIRRDTRLLDIKEDKALVKQFLSLFQVVHSCGKYTERQLQHMRRIWWTTMYKPRVLIKLLEMKANMTLEDVKQNYEKQLQAHRDHQKEKNYQSWLRRGVDLNDYSEDFTDAKGYDWIPEYYGTIESPTSVRSKRSQMGHRNEGEDTAR